MSNNPHVGGPIPKQFKLKKHEHVTYFRDGKTYSYKRVATYHGGGLKPSQVKWFGQKHWIDEWIAQDEETEAKLEAIFAKS